MLDMLKRTFVYGIFELIVHVGATATTVVIGLVAWALFAFWAHRWLIGVPVFS